MPDELTTADVLALIEDKTGKAISTKTWSSYVARGQAPKPARHLSRTPLYAREDIEQWITDRPGSGARTDLRP
ncbi:transcriptional regulator [Rhodococcus sp. 06-1474-1B]|uniref:helix-turn-helix transcriptional regulator n=1 Tax=unclassified Rhodococcus (in: high G+C Gram-positive bacteria) TaxID=192944 RepID=UPI000B9B135E|nr:MULTISPECIES: transcriptional regulator [unclassified Rhodococcus (in: high G+C Gram-positive bacteria)]OZD55868.1 transcriptional regulator [Rhodococcus sp. 06-1474-1B]OZF42412.1 transcriptional regulator [Rhodococcus sp. 14-1411-2a]